MPTTAEEWALRSHCGAQRFACNWRLTRVTANLAQRAAERSYGIPEGRLTPPASWSAWALRKEFNAVGVRDLAVLSTGAMILNPRPLEQALGRLRRLSRQAARRVGPDKRTGQQPSARWRMTQARIARAHARAASLRDGRHQLTTRLAATYGTVVAEDLNVAGMLRNRRLARRIGWPFLEFSGLTYLAVVEIYLLSSFARSAAERSRQVVELALRHGWTDEPVAGIAYVLLAGGLAWQGRLEEAGNWIQRAERTVRAEAARGRAGGRSTTFVGCSSWRVAATPTRWPLSGPPSG